MTLEQIAALSLFALASSITPGPNNLMLLASGANFGFRRSLPHILGIGFGFVSLLLLVGAGLAEIFDRHPQLRVAMQIASVAYLLWLAWKILKAAPVDQSATHTRPMTFLQAAAFQWVNPKGWAMALTAISVYAPGTSLHSVLLVALIFGAINVPSVTSWTLLGQQMARLLKTASHLRIFNATMAALLVASLYPLLRG